MNYLDGFREEGWSEAAITDLVDEAATLASAMACSEGVINPVAEFTPDAISLFWHTVDDFVLRTKARFPNALSFVWLWAEVESILRNGD